MFLAEWQATQAQIPPLIGHWQTDCLLQDLREDQRGDSQKGTDQGYMEGVLKSPIADVRGFQQFRCQCMCGKPILRNTQTCFNTSPQHFFSIGGFTVTQHLLTISIMYCFTALLSTCWYWHLWSLLFLLFVTVWTSFWLGIAIYFIPHCYLFFRSQ